MATRCSVVYVLGCLLKARPLLLQERQFLTRGDTTENLVSMREAAEAIDDRLVSQLKVVVLCWREFAKEFLRSDVYPLRLAMHVRQQQEGSLHRIQRVQCAGRNSLLCQDQRDWILSKRSG